MNPAARFPHDGCMSAGETAGPEPTLIWAGDPVAARRFGSPGKIRASLLREQVGEFDAASNLTSSSVLRMWRRQALLTELDPEGHRQMLSAAAEVTRTRAPRPGSVPWTELKAELGR